jgi:hypothetical protein
MCKQTPAQGKWRRVWSPVGSLVPTGVWEGGGREGFTEEVVTSVLVRCLPVIGRRGKVMAAGVSSRCRAPWSRAGAQSLWEAQAAW